MNAKLATSRYLDSARHCVRGLAAALLLALAGCASAPAPAPAPEPAPPAAAVDTVVQEGPVTLHVDHAWVKDAESPEQQELQRAAMLALRAKALAGGAFVATWNAMGLDGTNWHVAENEAYPADVLPVAVQDLPAGTVSEVVPGDGGLHLFRIISREPGL